MALFTATLQDVKKIGCLFQYSCFVGLFWVFFSFKTWAISAWLVSNGNIRSLSKKQQWVEHVYSYLCSECVAGTASWEWYNGAGQQNWCRVFKDLRHKEKHRVKPPGVAKGAFEGKAGANRNIGNSQEWWLKFEAQLSFLDPRGQRGIVPRFKCTHQNDGEELLQWRINQRFIAGLRSNASLRLGICLVTWKEGKSWNTEG